MTKFVQKTQCKASLVVLRNRQVLKITVFEQLFWSIKNLCYFRDFAFFSKRILAILDNIVMLLQREFEAKQQLRQQMRRKK